MKRSNKGGESPLEICTAQVKRIQATARKHVTIDGYIIVAATYSTTCMR